ncbi:MAG: hypothetical protein NTX03_03330 [Bacteroidetes bacterium]|nr:hypothetical protein [Bacteroidota bacterium]
MRRQNAHIAILSILFLCYLSACKKQVDATKAPDKFIKVYPAIEHIEGGYVYPLSDGGFVVITVYIDWLQYGKPIIYRLDKAGNLISKKVVPTTLRMQYISCARDVDGNFILTSYNQRGIYKISQDAEILWRNEETQITNAVTSQPYIDAQGSYYYSYENKYGSVPDTPKGNFLVHINPNGSFAEKIKWQTQPKWNLTPSTFNLYKVDNTTGDKYFCGEANTSPSPGTISGSKIYLLKIAKNNNTSIVYFDATNSNYWGRLILWYTPIKDDGLLILARAIDYNSKWSIQLIKVDKNMNLVWNKYYQIGNNSSIGTGLNVLMDGSYLITGFIYSIGRTIPAAMKVDENGSKLWEHTYDGIADGYCNHACELLDGSLLITGSTSSYGFGKNQGDIFLIKTDKKGNL